MRTLAIHSNHVRCLAYSPDGTLLATASNDRSVRVLEVATGKARRVWKDLGGVMQAVAWHPDGMALAFGGQTTTVRVALWQEGDIRHSFDLVPRSLELLTSLAYLPNGKTLLCGTGDRILRTFGRLVILEAEPLRARSDKEVMDGIHHLAVSRDGTRIVLGTGSGWSVRQSPHWEAIGHAGPYLTTLAVAFSPDDSLFAAAQGFAIRIRRPKENGTVRELKGHTGKITSLAFTPDGRHLVSGSWDRTVRIWPMEGGEPVAYEWERGKVQYVAVAPDGMTAAAACDKGVVIWDLDH